MAYPHAVATELDRRDVRLFDYAKQFALPFREPIRARTEQLADEEGVEISAHEDLPMESCPTYDHCRATVTDAVSRGGAPSAPPI